MKTLKQQVDEKHAAITLEKQTQESLTEFINQALIFEIIKESIHNEFRVSGILEIMGKYPSSLKPCASEQYGSIDQYELDIKMPLHPHELTTVVLADITLKDSNQFVFEFRKFDQTNITVDIIKDIINFLVGV